MIFLWLSIISSSGIYLLFKLSSKNKARLEGIIIVNYFFAALLGFLAFSKNIPVNTIFNSQWFPIAVFIGILFVVMFYLIGVSTHKAGISITAIATRMSMIFPVTVSMFIFNEQITGTKIFIIAIALLAILMAIYKPNNKKIKRAYIVLPFILFIGSGTADSLVKTAEHLFIPHSHTALFSSTLFAVSFFTSLFLLFRYKKSEKLMDKKTFGMGVLLGLCNFGSLFFIILALQKSNIDSSFIFSINNLAIVVISHLIGFLFFNEKLSSVNKIGLAISFICLILLTQIK
jgi:drug/metabolite transporter (DMT)-like permease